MTRTSRPGRANGKSDPLKRLFDDARRADAAAAPAFDRLWQPAGKRRRRRLTPLRLAAAAGLLAAAVLGLTLMTWNGAPPAPAQAETVRIDWQGPTDFLLEIDGELLSTLPAIGIPPSLPGADAQKELAAAR